MDNYYTVTYKDNPPIYYTYNYNVNDDLKKDFQTVVNKLLETKSELEDWVKQNFGRYLDKD